MNNQCLLQKKLLLLKNLGLLDIMLKPKLTVVVIFVYMSSKLQAGVHQLQGETEDVNAVIQEIIRGRGIKRPLGPWP